MKTKVVKVSISIICTPKDDALGSEAALRTKGCAVMKSIRELETQLWKLIPNDHACSVVVGAKIEDDN